MRETFSPAGLATLGRIAIIFVFVAVFWSLWDQSGGEWVTQAEKMDLHFMGIDWLASQIQAVNAIMILAFIPLFQYFIYPAISRVFPLTPLRKIGLGLIVTGVSFLVSAWIETQIAAGLQPSIGWQLPAYALLSAGEVMVSITGLEFAYTQAPKPMKAMVQAIYLLAVSAGNLFTALVHVFIANPDGTVKLQGPAYYEFFAALSIGCVAIYVFVAKSYREKSYLQSDTPVPLAEAAAGKPDSPLKRFQILSCHASPLLKRPKVYVGGAFIRSESARVFPLKDAAGNFFANIPQCTRKDLRNAVEAAAKAGPGWAKRTAYNRGQIIYRLGEMLEARSAEMAEALLLGGASKAAAAKEVSATVDRVIYYAGWADKYEQVLGNVNPVAAPYFNFTVTEPMGIVGVIAPMKRHCSRSSRSSRPRSRVAIQSWCWRPRRSLIRRSSSAKCSRPATCRAAWSTS